MTTYNPKTDTLIHLFTGVDLTDEETVASVIQELQFTDLPHQATSLQALRLHLGAQVAELASALALTLPTMERFMSGITPMKPVQLRGLALFLYVRATNPELFDQLLTVSGRVRRQKY